VDRYRVEELVLYPRKRQVGGACLIDNSKILHSQRSIWVHSQGIYQILEQWPITLSLVIRDCERKTFTNIGIIL